MNMKVLTSNYYKLKIWYRHWSKQTTKASQKKSHDNCHPKTRTKAKQCVENDTEIEYALIISEGEKI